MKRALISLAAGFALMLPGAAIASHTDWNYNSDYEYETMEDCEEALAEQRRMMTMGVRGRDRGQFNKDFNQRYQCEESEYGMGYMIKDYNNY
jgi:hypothetical protein